MTVLSVVSAQQSATTARVIGDIERSDTVWLEQYLLLSDPAEMDDIAEAIARIQREWSR